LASWFIQPDRKTTYSSCTHTKLKPRFFRFPQFFPRTEADRSNKEEMENMDDITKGQSDPPNAIRAAGGVVWEGEPWKSRVLVIFRARYGDHCLPKGKLRNNETFEEAAIREIREETGYRVTLYSDAGTLRYDVGGRPKIVRFWHAMIDGDSDFQPSEEVARVDWLTIDEALRQLDYDDERKLLVHE
jgi:8-oxo-dGTP diphosphatase